MIPVKIVYEDDLSGYVMEKMLGRFDKYSITGAYCRRGFGGIKASLKGYNNAAKFTPFFILTDLDTGECAPALIKSWFSFEQHPNLIFRVAVREVESWLLADREGFAKFASVNRKRIPQNPDTLDDPKFFLFQVIKKSKKRALKEDILPRYDGDRIGPNYNDRLFEFVDRFWNIEQAALNSQSLNKALDHLKNFSWIQLNRPARD